ncbi:DUF4276 family protein [Thermodesulfobacteriota bacterium]
MKYLIFLLEEPSAMAMLQGVLPRLLPENISSDFIVFEGKQDLEKQIERRLRSWLKPNSYFVVMRDQDSGDCLDIKKNLYRKCVNAGKKETLVRIACHELESFYLGDLAAVEQGLSLTGLIAKQQKRKYRTPDNLSNPSLELFALTNNKYQKLIGSRAIGQYLSLDKSNRSNSFNVLISGILKLIST